MSIKIARHYLLYFKDLFQSVIFGALLNSRWLTALTPLLAFAVRPLLAVTLGALALTQTWSFWFLHHKNIDGWLNTVGSLAGALLNNISAFGSLIARLHGVTFAAAPWLLVAGFGIGAVYQLTMAAINARRAYESPSNSAQRQHYAQSTSYNLVLATQLLSCVTGIVLFTLIPSSSLLIAGAAGAVVLFNIGTSLWRSFSSDTKKKVKGELGFGKPGERMHLKQDIAVDKSPIKAAEPLHCKRLFTTCNHSLVIKTMDSAERRAYLQSCIEKKLATLSQHGTGEKNRHKIEVLTLLQKVFTENHAMPHVSKLHQKHPRLADNFWCEKSDTQQLVDAVALYCKEEHEKGRELPVLSKAI